MSRDEVRELDRASITLQVTKANGAVRDVGIELLANVWAERFDEVLVQECDELLTRHVSAFVSHEMSQLGRGFRGLLSRVHEVHELLFPCLPPRVQACLGNSQNSEP